MVRESGMSPSWAGRSDVVVMPGVCHRAFFGKTEERAKFCRERR
jgi:hypothetical protein